MLRSPPLFILLGALLCLPSHAWSAEDTRPWKEQPFLGLSVRDTPQGLVVGWVSPGPLGGRGFESNCGIRRGDNVVSLDGKPVDRAGFETGLRRKKPGDRISLVTRRSPKAGKEASVPKGGEETTHEITLAARADWAGTIKRGLGGRTIPPVGEGAYEQLILDAAAEVGARKGQEGIGGGLDALLTHLAKRQAEALDLNSLPAVVNAFRQPLRLDAVEGQIAALAMPASGGDLRAVEELVRGVLQLPDPAETIRGVLARHPVDDDDAAQRSLVRFAGQHLEQQSAREQRMHAQRLLQTMRTDFYIYDDDADAHVKTINTHVGPRAQDYLTLALVMLRLAPPAWEARAAAHAKDEPLKDVPAAIRALVPEGDVLWHGKDALGHSVVVGGPGPNRYSMSNLGAVYDVGGDDRYEYGGMGPDGAISLRLVVDLAGNDVHEATADFEGPATGVFGLSLLDDRAGDDTYRSAKAFSIGAGLVGVGILLDHAGNDTYENRGADAGWSMGVGFWGAGLLIDRKGNDVYRGEKLAEGVGGPRGFGAILDAQGRDLYVANGPAFGSAYDTPAVYLGMSQGFGIGVRGYAAGGVGAIYDLQGNDRYEAGEFSQAGGYYWGLGILHDAQGNDLYYGNRYGQAFAAHQAVGVLIDDEGDDTYWSMTAASQGGTWDESIGLLLDRKGNDAYRCDGLGQGAASMQAIGLLIDLEGDDRYSAGKGATQGQSGGNNYHYDATKIFSFSGLFDLGGGHDSYTSGRKNGSVKGTGAFKPKNPANSNLYGVFVDR